MDCRADPVSQRTDIADTRGGLDQLGFALAKITLAIESPGPGIEHIGTVGLRARVAIWRIRQRQPVVAGDGDHVGRKLGIQIVR